MHRGPIGKALHRHDVAAVGLHGKHQAGPDGGAVDQDGARAAHALAAPDVGPGQAEIFAQHVDEQPAGLDADAAADAVDPQLDQLRDEELRDELRRNKALLEDKVGRPVTTMAYPYGYSSARVRREVRKAGYWAACAVNNAISADRHDVLALPRLTVGQGTTMSKFRRAVEGRGVPLIYLKERVLTKGYAVVRRTRYGLRQVARK